MTSKREIKNLLKKYQICPSKHLGQNFLVDKEAVKKIIEAADLSKKDVVLEIGPGLGTLTIELAKKAEKVIGIEKDRSMIEILRTTLKDLRNVEVIQEDILKIFNSQFSIFNKFSIFNYKYKVVGNLPFYLTAPVIRKFLESVEVRPQQMVLLIQKEVAQRICATPPDMSILAVSVQIYARPEIVSYISKKSFWPSPKVDSAILRINPQINTDIKQINTDLFFKIVKAGFSQPRKQLINNLSKELNLEKEKVQNWLLENNIQPTQRAETLSVDDWIKLTKTIKPR